MRFRTVPLFLHTAATAGLLLLAAGCSKSNDNNTLPTGMTAQINGKAFHAFQAAGGAQPYYYQVGGVGTLNGDTVFLTVYLATPVALNQQVSTDDNGFAEIDYVVHRNNAPYTTYSAFQGQKGPAYYTVTGIDTVRHTIQGTFNGALTRNGYVSRTPDSIIVTNGAFNTSYR